MIKLIISDFRRIYTRSVKSAFLHFFNVNFYFLIVFRINSFLVKSKILYPLLIIFYPLYHILRIITQNDISIKATIGKGLYLGHIGGVVISKRAKIGENADISHQVTIGVSGRGENFGAPTIGDNVYIAPGAKVFGKIIIGDNVKIGANAVVYKSLKDNSVVVVENSMKVLSYNGNK